MRGKKSYKMRRGGVVFIFLFILMQVIFAQDNKDIYFKYCVAHPKDACFNPRQGAVDTVGRDVAELGGGYLFCLKIDTVNAGVAPIRVVLVIDRSYSMCRNPDANNCCVEGDGSGNCMKNDPNDMRIKAAQTFVDSLAAKSPQSEIGVVPFFSTAVGYNPIPLNSPENIERVKNWIYEASCKYMDTSRISVGVVATYIGVGLQEGLRVIDYQYSSMPKNMKRHIIILTDGAWDDYNTRSPDALINSYMSRYPDRPVPIIHGVFLSDSALHVAHGYPPLGCTGEGLLSLEPLQRATTLGDTQGVFMSGSQPHTVVENFLTILRTMITYEPQRLTGMVVTNTTNNSVRTHKRIDTIPESDEDTAQYKATIDNLPLEFGPNVLTVQRIVKKPGTDKLDTLTSTVTIFRTKEWTTNVDPTSEEYQLYCVKD
ncbi:MAG: VWA domain-containing protein, partial [Chitinispirillaceae bacterium]|nr:VWA domain-containing protein [Chitinispirillaceae bacterium]